jgi:hypothetical protein
MSFKPYTEKVKQEKIGICSILGRIRIRIRIKMIRIRNTGIKIDWLCPHDLCSQLETFCHSIIYRELEPKKFFFSTTKFISK